jgi:cbb3-type cytochrome oxidase maturation protein
MSVLYVLVPVALALAACAVFAYTWSSRSGQFDDLTTPALRAILDEAPNRGTAGTATPPAPSEPLRHPAE